MSRLEPEDLAQVSEAPEDGLEGGGVNKMVEDLVGQGGVDGHTLGPAEVCGGARATGQRGRGAAASGVAHGE